MKSDLVKYCVVLREGEHAEKKQYFEVSKEVMEEALKPYTFAGGTPGTRHIIDMKPFVFGGNPEDIKKSKKLAKAHFVEGRIGSLEFHVDTEEDAIKCLEYLKLR